MIASSPLVFNGSHTSNNFLPNHFVMFINVKNVTFLVTSIEKYLCEPNDVFGLSIGLLLRVVFNRY